MKNIRLNKFKSLCGLALMSLVTLAVPVSCEKETSQAPYLNLENDDNTLSVTADGNYGATSESYASGKTFVVRSNVEWKVVATDTTGWGKYDFDVFPTEGEDDGDFVVRVKPQEAAYERSMKLSIVAKKSGDTLKTITVTQTGRDPFLQFDFLGSSVSVSSMGQNTTIQLKTNINWTADIIEGSSWLTLGAVTAKSQAVTAAPNTGSSRTGLIRFSMIGNSNVKVDLTIKQGGADSDPLLAELKTISQAIASVQSGVFKTNIKVKGYVISDRSGSNTPSNQMYIMDASGRGLRIDFANAAENIYNLNDLVTVHLVQLDLLTESGSGAAYIPNVTSTQILESTTSSGIAPIELSSISNLTSAHENTLVKFKNVEYMIPYGDYYSKDEANIYSGIATVVVDYRIPFQDASGNVFESYVTGGTSISTGASFKHSRFLPKGKGDLVGLVVMKGGAKVLVMRNLLDDQIGSTASARTWKVVSEWVWPDASQNVATTAGTGTQIASLNGPVTGGLSLYGPATLTTKYAYAYWRTNIAVQAGATDYQSVNTAGAGWSKVFGGATTINDATGWVISLSTAGYTGNMALILATSSSATGPGSFGVFYSTDGGTTYNTTPFATFLTTNWSFNYCLTQYRFDLPAECRNKSNVAIKIAPIANLRSDGSGQTIGSSGTNRVGYAAVVAQ